MENGAKPSSDCLSEFGKNVPSKLTIAVFFEEVALIWNLMMQGF